MPDQLTEKRARALVEAAGWKWHPRRDDDPDHFIRRQIGYTAYSVNLNSDADTARLRDAVCEKQGWTRSESWDGDRYTCWTGSIGRTHDTLPAARVAALLEAINA